jgi:hypothetical protein
LIPVDVTDCGFTLRDVFTTNARLPGCLLAVDSIPKSS